MGNRYSSFPFFFAQKDIDERKLLDNAVTAVFFLRALQAVGYFRGEVAPRR